MAAGKIEVDGLKELRKALKAAGESYDDLKDAGLEAAELVATTARNIVPRLSGRLESSIRPAGQAKGAVVRAGSAGVAYAGVQHFGWSQHHIEPHPFLYDAADQRANDVEQLYAQRVQDIADKVGQAT